MKLSEKIIDICKKHQTVFYNCINCPIEKECSEYRRGSIKLYEKFKEVFKRLEE